MNRIAKKESMLNKTSIIAFLLFLIAIVYLADLSSFTGNVVSSTGTTYVNLTIWYNQTGNINSQIPINTQVNFTANFTDQNGNALFGDGVMCNFTQNSSGSWSGPINMTFNMSSDNLYKFNMSFPSRGRFAYNITCYNYSLENVSLTESFIVTNCVPPASGDWLINESGDILCENKNLTLSGLVNVTGNLTLINSTINESLAFYFRNNSKFFILNSTIGGLSNPYIFYDNSTLFVLNSSFLAGTVVEARDSSKIIATNASFPDFTINSNESISLENLSQRKKNSVFLSSSNYVLNFSDTYFTSLSLNAKKDVNLTSSNITILNIENSQIVIKITNSIIEAATLGANITAYNLSIPNYAILSPGYVNLTLSTINKTRVIGDGNSSLSGNFTITDKSISAFDNTMQVTRFFPLYIYNGATELNGTLNVSTYGGKTLWYGNLTNSYALVNITFNSTTYTDQYNIYSPIGYVGKIKFLDDTPIIRTAIVSSIPLSAQMLTANGTLMNDSAYLSISSNKPLACMYSLAGAASTAAVKTASYLLLSNSTSPIRYNDTIRKFYPLLNYSHLPFLFTRDVFSEFIGANDNDVAYVEEFRPGVMAQIRLLGYGVSPYPPSENASTYLFLNNVTSNPSDNIYEYDLKFNRSIIYDNSSEQAAKDDLIGSRIKIQGISFNVSALEVNTTGGNKILNITFYNQNKTIFLGGNTMPLQINGSSVGYAYGYIIGTAGNWTGLNITFYPSVKVYLKEGESYQDPVFGNIKLIFTKLHQAPNETIRFVKITEDKAEFNFTSNDGRQVSVPYSAYSNITMLGRLSTEPLLFKGQKYNVTNPGNQTGMMFFFVSSTDLAHILRLDAMDTGNHTLALYDLTYGISYTNLNYTNSSNVLNVINLSIGNITLNISDDQLTIVFADSPKIVAKTQNNARISLSDAGILFNENSISGNNVTVLINASSNNSNLSLSFNTANTLSNGIAKIYDNLSITLANTPYGTIIENDNQNSSWINLYHPNSSTYADIYIADNSTDISALIAGTISPSSRYMASSAYQYNNLSLTCTDGIETKYFDVNVLISKSPQFGNQQATPSTTAAEIYVLADIEGTARLDYGPTQSFGNSSTNSTVALSHGFLLANLAPNTDYYYNLTICDIYGRCTVTGPNLFTTSYQQSGADGGSRINYVASNSIVNKYPVAQRIFSDIKADQSYSSELKFGKIYVSDIQFSANKDMRLVQFRFYMMSNNSGSVPALSDNDKVFTYMNFTISKAAIEDISEMNVSFKVPKDWFTSKGFSKESIALNRYADSWAELQTDYLSEDPFFYYYKSRVPGFSIFAITATKGSLPTAVSIPSSSQTPSQSQSASSEPQPSSPPAAPTNPAVQGSQDADAGNSPQEESPGDISSFSDRLKSLAGGKLFVPIAIAILALLLIGGGLLASRKSRNMVVELARKQMTNQEVINELKAKGVYGQSLEELRQFIAAAVQQGKNANEIKGMLLSVGWEEHTVDDVFQLFNVH